MAFKPLLSATADIQKDPDVLNKLVFPLYGSVKLDGIRTIIREGKCVSRKLLALPRPHVQQAFSHLEHMDGEIIVGNASDHDVYNRTQSYVMSKDERPEEQITLYVFDWADESWAGRTFDERYEQLYGYVQRYKSLGPINLEVVEQKLIRSVEELLAFEEETLAQGYEGIMLRSTYGQYKHGRSTFKEQTLIKCKRMEDIECVVIGFVEQLRNENLAELDELGHTKRSSAKDGMVPADTLGKFLVRYNGMELEIPPGAFKHAERKHIWGHREAFLGKTLKVRHFPHGAKDKLRLPRALGWRTEEDL